MNKHFFILIVCLLGGWSAAQAQNKEDSLLLRQLVSSPDLIEGKAYFVETNEQNSSPEYRKSQLVREKETPLFDARRQLTNGLPYNEFGNKPIVFQKQKMGKVKVGTETVPCFILSFTCGDRKYASYEFRESLSRATYNLVEADLVNRVNELLAGKTLYTQSANWFAWRTAPKGEPAPVREGTYKYNPVSVTRVVNDYDDKYLVFFKPLNQDGEYCFINIELTGDRADIFRYFTFANPQEKHPGISQEHWELIMAQKVKQGFTPDEVKIAYGEPDETYTENDDDTWVYYNLNKKDYAVTFKEGIVEKVISQTSTYY